MREVGGGVEVAAAAGPADVEEEEGDEEDDGKEGNGEEEGPAADLEVPVVELDVVPVEGLGVWRCH